MKQLIFATLLLIGCATMNMDVVKPTGERCNVSVNRMFWVTNLYDANVCGASITAQGTASDPAIKAIVEALLQATKVK